jgi:hypothetical protein
MVSIAEDEEAAARISSKNGLESYTYNLRNSITDEKLADKFDPADKTKLEAAVNEAISWLDNSQEASKEEYDGKQKELESIAKYVMFTRNHETHILTIFFLALSCRNSTRLVVLLVASLVVLVVSLVVLLVVVLLAVSLVLVAARKAPALRRSTKGLWVFIFVSLSPLHHLCMSC